MFEVATQVSLGQQACTVCGFVPVTFEISDPEDRA